MADTNPEPESFGLEPIPDDPHRQIKAKLSEFLLSLIQAFLRTGYYTPDHPESKSARIGLYENFKTLFRKKGEVTILVRNDPNGRNILIEGILPESHYLDSLMFKGMAEMYSPKFAKFLERKDLISLTLQDTMTRSEFTQFIDVMSEPTFVDTHDRSDKERFVRTLQDRGIFHISYIFSEELLAAKRKIPWRSQIALSRLNKDFRTIPLFFDLDMEAVKNVRRQIIQDVARPLQNSEIIYPILMNSDLSETKEFKESEIDDEIIACLSDELLLKSSMTLLKETLGHKNTQQTPGKSALLAEKIASVLNHRETKDRDSILEQYYKNNLIPFKLLTENSRNKTKVEALTNKFLEHSESFFRNFDTIQEKEKYLRAARSCTNIIPELIRRARYNEIHRIIGSINRHAKEQSHISVWAKSILDEMGTGKVLQVLKGKFLTGNKEIREAIAPIFLELNEGSVPHLLSLFMESDDQVVRKDAWDILIQIDSSATEFIISELRKKELKTESAIDLIRILGEIKCDKLTEPLAMTLRAYLKHKNPHLREEALWAYYKLRGAMAEKLYLGLLNDMDVRVIRKAVQCLGKIKSATGFEKVLEILKKAEDVPSEMNQKLESHLFRALGFFGNFETPNRGSLEDLLLKTLDRRLDLGPLKFLKKKENPLDEKAVAAICQTLGTVGTEKSYPILQKLEKQFGRTWQYKAEEALEKISQGQEDKTGHRAS